MVHCAKYLVGAGFECACGNGDGVDVGGGGGEGEGEGEGVRKRRLPGVRQGVERTQTQSEQIAREKEGERI